VPISGVQDAGIKLEGEGSSGVRVSYEERRGGGHPQEPAMWPTWETLPTWWNHVMRVVLVAVVLCVSASACTAPGRSISTPAVQPSDGGQAGAVGAGNGGGGY
jgi:hypothetical protein